MNKDRIMAYIDNQSEIKKCVETQFPFFIAHEYHRFYELLEKGQLFGAFFEMKDVLEVLLKFPILVGTAYIESKREPEEGKRCLETLIAHPLSLGQWAAYGNDLRKILQKDEAAKPLYQVLRSILQLYNRTGVVNWRNTRIGHGAVAGDIMQYAEDFKKYSTAINKHCMETESFYTELNIMLGGKKLKGYSLPKWDEITVCSFAGQTLEASFSQLIFDLRPYIFVQEGDIYFFDSMNSWRLVIDALDYVKGRKIVVQSEFFLKKYRELTGEGKYLPETSVSDVVFSSDNQYLNELNLAENFTSMDNLDGWLAHCLNDYDRGVFMLKMERGMGKTAFVSSIDQLIHGDDSRDEWMDVVVRCYYCNRLEFRSTNDFVAVCNTALFSKNRDAQKNIEGSEKELRTLSLTGKDPAQQMSDYLGFYQEIYDKMQFKEKLLLVIDGLDEITADRILETGHTIFDYIPAPQQLAENVYILLTCRTGEEEPLSQFVSQRIEHLSLTESYTVDRKSTEHEENLQRYLKKILSSTAYDQAEAIINRTGRNYVGLKLFVSLMGMEISVRDLLEMDNEYRLSLFLQKLQVIYGEKVFKKTIQFLTLIVNAYTPLSLSQITFLMGYREMPMEMLTIMYELGCLLDLKRTETGTKIRLANETFRQHLRENYADVMQAQLSDWIQMILVQGSKELDNGASADLYKNEGAIYLYGNIMKYVEEWAAEAQKAVVYTNAFAGAIYQFEGKVDGRNHGYQGVLLDIGMTSGAIQIYGSLEADKQKVDWLNYAYCYNNRAYHKGITLSDAEGGERDLARAYEIVSGMPERDAKVLSAMGTFSNNMAALMSKWHYPLAEASVWSHRSIEARRQLMYLDFAENAENYMQSLLNYAGLLCKYGAMDELASLYQEINTICDEINAQYPDAYGMLRPKGNRVNFGYVFQRASMRTKYAQSLAEKGKTMAGDSDCYEKAAGLYEESLTELRELLAFTGGEQMAVHEALYKACFYLGRIYVLLEQQEKADACWNESFMHIHKLKSRGKLYQNGVLEEIKGMFPEAVQ